MIYSLKVGDFFLKFFMYSSQFFYMQIHKEVIYIAFVMEQYILENSTSVEMEFPYAVKLSLDRNVCRDW